MVSQRQLTTHYSYGKMEMINKQPKKFKLSNWKQANSSDRIRPRRLRQIWKAWNVYEMGARGSTDERRQASQLCMLWQQQSLYLLYLSFFFTVHNELYRMNCSKSVKTTENRLFGGLIWTLRNENHSNTILCLWKFIWITGKQGLVLINPRLEWYISN